MKNPPVNDDKVKPTRAVEKCSVDERHTLREHGEHGKRAIRVERACVSGGQKGNMAAGSPVPTSIKSRCPIPVLFKTKNRTPWVRRSIYLCKNIIF